jgi:hypothetical protein
LNTRISVKQLEEWGFNIKDEPTPPNNEDQIMYQPAGEVLEGRTSPENGQQEKCV